MATVWAGMDFKEDPCRQDFTTYHQSSCTVVSYVLGTATYFSAAATVLEKTTLILHTYADSSYFFIQQKIFRDGESTSPVCKLSSATRNLQQHKNKAS